MTPDDIFFILCLFAPFIWFSAPISERRTTVAKPRTTKKRAVKKKSKGKRTKQPKRTKKEPGYKAPPLSVDQQLLDTRYILGRDFKTYHKQ